MNRKLYQTVWFRRTPIRAHALVGAAWSIVSHLCGPPSHVTDAVVVAADILYDGVTIQLRSGGGISVGGNNFAHPTDTRVKLQRLATVEHKRRRPITNTQKDSFTAITSKHTTTGRYWVKLLDQQNKFKTAPNLKHDAYTANKLDRYCRGWRD